MNFADCLHIVLVIRKYTDAFQGRFFSWRWMGVTREELSMDEFFLGEGIFHGGGVGFPSIV